MRCASLLVLVVLGGVLGCGPKQANQCASNVTARCLNGEVCSLDRKRGCQVCQCRPLDEINTGNDPDDPNPPIPVR